MHKVGSVWIGSGWVWIQIRCR